MYNHKKLAVAMAGALVLLPIFAATVTGNARSDYDTPAAADPTDASSLENDWCNAVDPDGLGRQGAQGESTSCDADMSTTTVTATYNGGLLADCQELSPAGTNTVCTGGIALGADPASGSLGLDSPQVTSVGIDISVSGAWTLRACTTDVDTNADNGCTLGTTVCLTAAAGDEYVITINGGNAVGPPVSQLLSNPQTVGTQRLTIDTVIGWRETLIGCNTTGVATPAIVTATWTYVADIDGDLAGATAVVTTPTITANAFPPGTCAVTWSGTATGEATYSEAEVLYSSGNTAQEDYTIVTGPGAIAMASDVTGINTNLIGQEAIVSAQVWSWGEVPDYATDDAGGVCIAAPTGDIIDAILDLLALGGHVCAAVQANGGYVLTPTCGDGTVCVPTGPLDATCTLVDPCDPAHVADTLALAVPAGAASAEVLCSLGVPPLVSDANTVAPATHLGPLVPGTLDIFQAPEATGTYTCNLNLTGSGVLGVAVCIDDLL